jgi:ferredoxin/flavodoxin---NADP+ reductase
MPVTAPHLDPSSDVVDLVIIGAGPVGLYGAFYAGLRKMSVTLIDSLSVTGGQLASLYPEKNIFDVAGFPKVLAKDLVRSLTAQGLQFGAKLALGERVQALSDTADTFEIQTDKARHRAKTILIAAGIGAFEPKRLSLQTSDHIHPSLHYHVERTQDFDNKRILIVGGGDSAIDWANALSSIAASVTLIHRSDRFRAHEQAVADFLAAANRAGSSSKVMTFHELTELHGESRLEAATVTNNRTGVTTVIPLDAVLVNIGFESGLGPLREWGLELEGSQIKVDPTMSTSRPGIYAAGDICVYPGKLKLLVTGFGEAAVAVNYAKRRLSPTASIFPGHSSNMLK